MFKLLLMITLFSFQLQASDIYNGENPNSDEIASEICSSLNGYYLGSFALIKTQDGDLHPSGPNQEQVSRNFTALSQQLTSSNTQVDLKYGDEENWEWLEIRFACYQQEQDSISFVLRARSTGGILRSYELTYVYSAQDIIFQNNRMNFENADFSEPVSDGWSINGLFEESIDSAFVMSVLNVAFGESEDEVEQTNHLQ